MSTPLVHELTDALTDLVDWETFGVYLKGVKYEHILAIQKKAFSNEEGKLQLFHKWLTVCPDASWDNVVEALEKTSLIVLAEKVKNEKCKRRPTEPVTSTSSVVTIDSNHDLKTENEQLKLQLRSMQKELLRLQQLNKHLHGDRERIMNGISERDRLQCNYTEQLKKEIRTMKLTIEKLSRT